VSALARPGTLEEALAALAADADARPIAGGVGLLLRTRFGEPLPERVVAIGRLAELRAVEPTAHGGVSIGAATTLGELARSTLARERVPLLAAASEAAANPGIRTTGTLGGNLLDRPGASDLAAASLALGGQAVWARTSGQLVRTSLTALLAPAPGDDPPGPGVLVALVFDAPAPGSGFERLTTRGRGDRPAMTVAAAMPGPGGERVTAWATSIADRPVPLPRAAPAALDGASPDIVGAALEHDLAGVSLVDDARATAAYRRRVLPVLLARAVAAARGGS